MHVGNDSVRLDIGSRSIEFLGFFRGALDFVLFVLNLNKSGEGRFRDWLIVEGIVSKTIGIVGFDRLVGMYAIIDAVAAKFSAAKKSTRHLQYQWLTDVLSR